MSDVRIRTEGRAGRITLARPQALNALTPGMGAQIEAALDSWACDGQVALVVIDAEGDRAFCAGGDIALIHAAAMAGDLETPRRFWRDEYRLNAKIVAWPKPIVAFMQGVTMGGGVGLGGHATHRIVGETSRIAMPECGIGLVPDVGGSLILARAPGHLGEYLGTTGHRMGPACAIRTGFADLHVPHARWPGLVDRLVATSDPGCLHAAATDPGPSPLAGRQGWIDRHFAAPDLAATLASLEAENSDPARETVAALARVSPLSACVTVALIRTLRARDTIDAALEMEYRATHRAIAEGDLVEGIRAAVIERDGAPRWRHDNIGAVPHAEAEAMLAPLGADQRQQREST